MLPNGWTDLVIKKGVFVMKVLLVTVAHIRKGLYLYGLM